MSYASKEQKAKMAEQIKNKQEIEQAAKFLARMNTYILNGMSFEEAGKKVLSDDKRLSEIVLNGSELGNTIKKEIMQQVYFEIKPA
jgi:hypothetical protein